VADVSLDDDDPVFLWQQPSELVGDDLSAHAATKNQDRFRLGHDSISFR
jgi:hypothetical protein